MRVLVTGGTGFIGRALVGALRRRGDEVVVVSRRPAEGAVGWDAIDDAVARSDAVVHLAGEPVAERRWTPERLARIRASRVETTERVAAAIQRAARKPRVLVSGSAVGIYGMRTDDEELDERAPAGDDVLARIVVAWEQAADAARSAGVRVVQPRTGVVLGLGGGALPRMATAFRWFVGGPIGSGGQWVSWIHLRDVVRALTFALDRDALVGPFNLVAPFPVTMDTFARGVARALDRPSALRVPAVALKIALGEGLARVLLTGQRVVPRKLLDAGFVFDFTRIEEACADLLRAR
ncbi:MAG TPA: TIGR01777 family oxidoreductase [Polyangiaceae bacterium]|nr:TIGR01777 family oxidoreductase [Polyangiaceae bacterium]